MLGECKNRASLFLVAVPINLTHNLLCISWRFQDIRTDYTKQNIKIVVQNDETLQFMTGVKVVTNGNGEEELWMLTNRFQV